MEKWIKLFVECSSLIAIVIGLFEFMKNYKLKLKGEIRLQEQSKVNADISLLNNFTKIMEVAHARGGYKVSETIIEKYLEKQNITKYNDTELSNLNDKIETGSILTFPVGAAAQDAAIASIYELGTRHEILKNPALQGLKSLSSFHPLAKKYFNKLNINRDYTE